ncbi:uncharacterized protein [Paramisgurnus dabryanus]|uniref:uncharacterized protein n=1 Tax=Paramisgurnus dabryanus TaxID=90735 RepID=UPI0031F3A821
MSTAMSTSMGEKQVCDTKSSNGGNMDSLPYNLNKPQNDQLITQPKPVSVSLSKLAELISRIEYKPKHHQSSICKDCGQSFPNLVSLVDHQEREHALEKLYSCQRCGQKFALLASLHLHICPSPPPMCQACRGKPKWASPCTTCGAKPPSPCLSEEPSDHDNSPYVCAPCGRAFIHKQELLYHQQAGGCQPVPVSPSSPAATPSPSSSSPSSPPCARVSSSTCVLCSRTFRSAAGLGSHQRHVHPKKKKKKKRSSRVITSGTMFPCRSCDEVFSQTSLLQLHRKEEHRREIVVRKTQRNSGKTTRQRRKGETYPCLHCGKVFLHHLTRWAHFKHFSAHHQTHLATSSKSTKVGFNPKATNESGPLEGRKLLKKRGRPRTKPLPVSKDSEQKVKTDDGDTDEDEEFTCVLCENAQAALKAHEEVPETADACRCCSVCTAGITLDEIPENCESKVYHCVPCAETFIALEAFLEHCQKHLIREKEEDEDLLSD